MSRSVIVFVANHQRSISWNKISQGLIAEGYYTICMVFTDEDDQYVDISKYSRVIHFNEMNWVDMNFDTTVFQAKDRYWKHKSHVSFKLWFGRVVSQVNYLFENFSVGLIFGEVSWAHEEYLREKSEYFAVSYCVPSAARFLERKFIIFNGKDEKNPVIAPGDLKLKIHDSNFTIVPSYFESTMSELSLGNRILKGYKFSKLTFVMMASKIKYLIWNIFEIFKIKKFHYRGYERIVFYGFQVQPEASIDYLAHEYADQADLIERLLKKLSINDILVIKDHPGEIHNDHLLKSIKLLFKRKVVYLSTDFDIWTLPKKTLFITPTGTIAGQAALKGYQSYTLKPVFFNSIMGCSYLEDLDLLWTEVPIKEEKLDATEFKNYLESISFDGFPYYTQEFGWSDDFYVRSLIEIVKSIDLG